MTLTFRGAPGTVPGDGGGEGGEGEGAACGVTGADGEDAGLVRLSWFVASTVKVYAVPLERSVTSHVRSPAVVHVCPPGLAITRY